MAKNYFWRKWMESYTKARFFEDDYKETGKKRQADFATKVETKVAPSNPSRRGLR